MIGFNMISIHLGIDRTRYQLTKPEQVNSFARLVTRRSSVMTEHVMQLGYDRIIN